MNIPSLKIKMALAVSSLFVVVIAVLAWCTISFLERSFVKAIATQQYALVSTLADNIDDKLRITQNALIAAANKLPPDSPRDAEQAQQFLDNRSALLSLFDNGVFLFAHDGRLIAESPYLPGRRGRDFSFREYHKHTLKTGKPHISKPFTSSRNPGHPVIMLTAPINDNRGRVVAILGGEFNLSGKNLLQELSHARHGTSGYFYMTDQERTVIVNRDKSLIMTRSLPVGANKLYEKALHGFEGSGETLDADNERVLTSFRHLRTTGWLLAASMPLTEAYAPLTTAKQYLHFAAAGITIAVLVITWLMMKHLTRPLAAITRHVESLPDSVGLRRLPEICSGDEIGTLATAFNRMVEALENQQTAHRESEDKFAKSFRATPSILTITTLAEETYIEVNETFERLIGYRREEVIGRTPLELGIWENPEERNRIITALHRDGRVRDIEAGLRNRNGDPFVGLLSAEIIKINGEECALVLVNDITVRKKFEGAVLLSEARLEALRQLNEMADAPLQEITNFAMEEMVRLTGSGIGYLAFTNEDETVLTMFSWSKDAMAECAISNKPIVYPIASTGLWGEAVRQRRPIVTNDYAAPNPYKKGYPQGHVRLLRHMNAPIFDGERIVIVAGVGNKGDAYDETDVRQLTLLMQGMWRLVQRKRLIEALSERERFLRTVIDTEPECVKLLASDGTLLMMNKAGLAMIGADSLDQVRGQSIYPLVAPEHRDAFIRITEGVFQGSEGRLEFEIVGLNGRRLWLDTHAVPFCNEHGAIVSLLAITRDVTESKQAEEVLHEKTLLLEHEVAERKKIQEALVIKQRQLEKLNGSLGERITSAVNDLRQKDQALIQQNRLAVMGEMINNIAHQWRQPLNNVGLLVQSMGLFLEKVDPDSDEMHETIRRIMDNLVFMSNTIDDFRNFFRKDKQRHNFSINKSVESALEFVGASLKNSCIKIDLTRGDRVSVIGYRNEYAQALLNIISNARDVLLERKVSDPGISIDISAQEGRSVVTITDNAGGIPKEILPRIFDPYFTTKEAGIGTGIGLYMSKVIIEQNMGGRLTARNTDSGAEFRIEV